VISLNNGPLLKNPADYPSEIKEENLKMKTLIDQKIMKRFMLGLLHKKLKTL
jgi:hypothetical protein